MQFENENDVTSSAIDNYAKDGEPGEVWFLCSFYDEPFHT